MEAGDLPTTRPRQERAVLVGIRFPRQEKTEVEGHLDELARLTSTAGGVVVGTVIQDRRAPDSAHGIGRGKAEEVADRVRAERADLVVFDEDLTPGQVRNLERLIQAKVIDRSALILDIFAHGARTREARTQVELAQLRYLLPRLTRHWTHLSRQVGGIGVRGVGETQLEIDRRIIRRKITRLAADLLSIERSRQVRRRSRRRTFQAVLVGYTNGGKSTLLNRLTNATAGVADRLFATLDPMTRKYRARIGRDLLLTDTVGFIRKLPHALVASFRSTLQEAVEADLLLHVIDLSHPDYEQQAEVDRGVLVDLGALERPRITVYNKIDRVADPAVLDRARRQDPEGVFVSAARGEGIERLRERLEAAVAADLEEEWVSVPNGAGPLISRIHSLADVLATACEDGILRLRIRASHRNASRIRRLVDEANLCAAG